ncbi:MULTISPECIES: O-antigen ligase family protein [Sinorhizobium]|uniref:Exopolysaccharide biosynthesis protein n=2 Tax=Sinorhizobium TaxID=28105 RepID=A0A2S3YJW4_9HYPH|nr:MULTISPECIES: O-antigen ligase [Sinorhizobium]AUX79795.1 O-antigen ligase-related protein [Sinorhizobium fredii]PDT41421.1 exopolysaccharide biosynthesis protein [Sinorhizobium sp. FG01]POH27628.1 exopolysaccharide biosynthesis protein [Sinorhizobium americanum]
MTTAAFAETSAPDIARARVGAFLFMAMFLFLWVSITPYVDLTGEAILDPSAGNSNRLNQILALLLSAGMLGYGLLHPMRDIILQPRLLLAILSFWFLLVSLISAHPMLGIKGIVLSTIMTVNASIYLLLPASERHFAKMLGIGSLIMLGFAYYGILFKPTLAIHQASELREPMNAGLWRGHFPHKNSAASGMVLAAFFGLFVASSWSRITGLAIFALSFLFLVNTGGKTSTAMLPAILMLGWLFEKMRPLRALIVIGGVGLFNLFAVGSAVFRPLGEFITGLGIDATFTNRSDIWRFAFSALAERPLTGYGFRAFWQTEELVYSGGSVETWAVAAANGHNSYLDIALTTGFPGLLLTLVWLILLPLRDISRIAPEREKAPLTRLYIRIWLYTIFHAGLETLFFEGGSFVWFTFVFAIYGLHLQSSAVLAKGAVPEKGKRVAHA